MQPADPPVSIATGPVQAIHRASTRPNCWPYMTGRNDLNLKLIVA